jgi:hypothetical protein
MFFFLKSALRINADKWRRLATFFLNGWEHFALKWKYFCQIKYSCYKNGRVENRCNYAAKNKDISSYNADFLSSNKPSHINRNQIWLQKFRPLVHIYLSLSLYFTLCKLQYSREGKMENKTNQKPLPTAHSHTKI